MMPAYRNMDSYPYHKNQTPFSHSYYHPAFDPSKPPFSYEQIWPYACNFPTTPHFCCSHNFPGYYNHRPSYPHPPSPSPFYFTGGYPQYGEPFFVPYPPQPHHTMELPRYEYDKSKFEPLEHHCCGCPNHPCNQKEGRSVKIEEQDPDVRKKVSNDDALVPSQFKNYPYPFVWIPPEYMSNRQMNNRVTPEVIDHQDRTSHDKKPSGFVNFNGNAQPAQEPRVWNGWLPVDMKGVSNMVHDGDRMWNRNSESDNNGRESEDERMNQKHQIEHRRNGFPFPVIWLPYLNKQDEEGKANNHESASMLNRVKDVPHTFKIVPVNSKVTNGSRSDQDEPAKTGGSEVMEKKKVTNERTIPVKQIEMQQGKNDSEGSEKREKVEEYVRKEDSGTNVKRQSSSSPKASKLPPVCLRVDPLPKKRNGSRSSRSPSPPSSKDHSQAAAGDASKIPSCGVSEKAQPNSGIQDAPNTNENVKPKERIIQVTENKERENKDAETKVKSKINVDVINGVSTGSMESYKDGGKDNTEAKTAEKCDGDKDNIEINKEEKGAENVMEKATEVRESKNSSPPADGGIKERRIMSDADAVVLIQAAYRGYIVRKWEPLKKLKQIAKVNKEVTDVRSRILAFEGCSDLKNDEKQKIAIGETIMRLLLKLDTIQGLHPNFREIRKSLARELITLQERLDSIVAKKPEPRMQESVVQQSSDVTPLDTQNGDDLQQQHEKSAAPEDSFEGITDRSHEMLEKCEDKSPSANDAPASESQSPPDLASNEEREPIVPTNGLVNEDTSQEVNVDELNSTSDHVETEKVAMEPEAKPEVKDIPIEVDKIEATELKELPVGAIDEDENDTSHEKDEQNDTMKAEDQTITIPDKSLPAMDDSAYDEAFMKELPVGVLDEEEDTTKSEFETQEMKELPVGLLDEDTETPELEKTDEMKEVQAENGEYLLELPVGVLDEETTKSESEKSGESRTYKEILLAHQAEECEGDQNTSSSTGETSKEAQQQEQLVEEKEEVQSSVESDGWVKVEFQEEDEQLNGDAKKTEDISDVCLEVNDAMREPTEVVPNSNLHMEEEVDAKIVPCKVRVDEKESMEKTEELQLPVADHDVGSNGDTKLLEENEKLRKMMMKLLEAGNDQLSVISSLTERVKGLEKKLAKSKSKSKRAKTRRCKPTTSKMSCMKHPNNALQKRTTDVVM